MICSSFLDHGNGKNRRFANETPFLWRNLFFVSFELYVEETHQLLSKDSCAICGFSHREIRHLSQLS